MKLIFAISAAFFLSTQMPDPSSKIAGKPEKEEQEPTEETPLFSFGVISDVQYADCNPAGERHYRSSLEKLQEAVDEFRKDSVMFIVNLGDLIDRDYESYKPVLGILNSSGIKIYSITGNHDYAVDPRYLGRLPVFTESREGYFSIIYRKYRFIFTNGNEISTYASASRTSVSEAGSYISRLKQQNEPNAIEWNGGISSRQMNWIGGQLDEAAGDSERVVIFCHFPVAPENIHNLLNYRETVQLLSKYNNIVAWISGHNHEGGYAKINHTNFVTMKGMVETRKENSFAVVEAYPDKLLFKGYGRENTYVLDF